MIDQPKLSALAEKLKPFADAYAAAHGAHIDTELGSGGSASVFLMKRPVGDAALKVYDPKFFDEKNGPAEARRIELQRALIGHGCPNLIAIDEIALQDGTCFIEMEYLPWQELRKVVTDVPAEKIEQLFNHLINAVVFLEDAGLVHRDIKPENILVSPDFGHLKLIDFGVMRDVSEAEDSIDATDHGLRRPFIASAQYSSPEYLFRLMEPSAESWLALTVYQVGGVLHDLVCRKPLFIEEVLTENKFRLAMAVLKKVPDFSGVPPELQSLALISTNCLVKDPLLRLQLVDLRALAAGLGGGVDKLKQMIKRRQTLRAAEDMQQQRAAELKRLRTTALDRLQKSGKGKLIQVVEKAYGLTTYAAGDHSLVLDVTIGAGLVLTTMTCFEWQDATNPLLANVYLSAVLGEKPSLDTAARKAMGQFAVDDPSEQAFSDNMLDMLTRAIACAIESAELVPALGERKTQIDVVAML